ncbi:MAG TPA: hypothetical protein VGK97_08355 [Spongiibacteraceae bacterium]
MRGRAQAIGVAVAGVVLPFFVWISAAVVGLVVLRRSPQDAFIVLGWSVLAAAAAMFWHGDPGPISALLGIAIAATVLRWTRSWPLALVAIVAAGLLSGLVLKTLGASFVAELVGMLNEFLLKLREQMPAEQAAMLGELNAAQVSGLLGLRSACLMVIALLVARWWQALLYNPGGFREEFHRLRLPVPVVVGLIAAGLAMALAGSEYKLWAALFALPFVVAGFALVHGVIGIKRWGRGPLVVLYLAWVFVWEIVTAALLLLAVIDSCLDFRARLRARSNNDAI